MVHPLSLKREISFLESDFSVAVIKTPNRQSLKEEEFAWLTERIIVIWPWVSGPAARPLLWPWGSVAVSLGLELWITPNSNPSHLLLLSSTFHCLPIMSSLSDSIKDQPTIN